MSKNRELNKDSKLNSPTEEGISSSRRQFTKTGLLASPVLMSVVSRPVFGVGCLSNMLSGNMSDPNRGECNLGLSTGYWKEHPEAWPISAGFKPDNTVPNSCNDCISGNGPSAIWVCTDGALFNSYFTTGPQDPQGRSMHELLCTEPGSDEFHIIAALLNALTDPNYVLSESQVKMLWADPTLGGQITDFKAFLNSTWT
ncbi:MAG: hypothetical protein C0630_02530 [Sedimenticola selenatireducens]|uniref:Uncharacterized protein n=1 Tax=Sedimenticola selenatireducens TaxID=191960 RepID=A0A2N6D073_9GAMM|nr:MAG: hypothetical protein C0630_02530 [Sedimenticola selenatireducens]